MKLTRRRAWVASVVFGPQSWTMRYRDASHVDRGSFYARLPELGKMYRFLGYAALLVVWWNHQNPAMLERLLIVLIVLWLIAWYRIVGTLWRSSTVAAVLLCATLITMHRLHIVGAQP